MALLSSQDAIDLIVFEEVSSEALYQKLYQSPTWPGGASGVTIGIGYDCGYSTAAQIEADWGDELSPAMVRALQEVAGITGSPASSHSHELHGVVVVPFNVAMAIFLQRDMPKWEGIVQRALPNTDKLKPDSFGSLTSLTYNRGASYNLLGDRYREMHNIHDFMAAQNFAGIPNQFRSMERLWPNASGLRNRRESEAKLFEKGLAA